MPGSLSRSGTAGRAPSCWISSHELNSRSSVIAGRYHPRGHEPRMRGRDHQHRQEPGSAVPQRDLAGREPHVALGGVAGLHTIRSAGSIERCSRRSRFTSSRNHRIEPVQPTRSASTAPGMSGDLRQHRPHRRLKHGERPRPRSPHIPPRRGRAHRRDHPRPRDPQPLRDPRLRHPIGRPSPRQRQMRTTSSWSVG